MLLVTSMATIPSSFLSVIISVVNIYLQPPAQIIQRNGLVFNPINITGEHFYSFPLQTTSMGIQFFNNGLDIAH